MVKIGENGKIKENLISRTNPSDFLGLFLRDGR